MPDESSSPSWRHSRSPAGRPNAPSDLEEEIRFHLDMRAAEYAAAGADPDLARHRALRKFGNVAGIRAETLTIDQRLHRRAARADLMTALLQDTRYALRAIRLTPGFSSVVTVTLALGIGLTTVMFGVVDHVLLRPLPYPAAERLVALGDVQTPGQEATPISYPEYLDWKQHSTPALTQAAAWFQSQATLTGGQEPILLLGERMSVNLPSLLGVRPLIGRSFQPDDELTVNERTVMLSEDLWRRRFASDPSVLGRKLVLNGVPHTVIGVFPAGSRARLPNELASGRRTEYWAPLRLTPESAPRNLHFMYAMGQRREGLSLDQTRQRLAAMSAALEKDNITTHDVHAVPLEQNVVGDVGGLLRILIASVGMLLFIACANVANLLLARAAVRQREFAIRAALGAGRRRILSQLLAESVVRGVVGGALGIGVAYGVAWAMRHWLIVRLPRFEQVAIDARVLAFAVALSVITGLAFGLVPGLRASRSDLRSSLHETGRGVFGSIRRDRFRRVLITGEVALSFVLLVGAGLLVRSFAQLSAVPLGFDADRLVTAYVALPRARYADSTAQRAFFARATESISAVPGVEGMALASSLPIDGGVSGAVLIEGRTFSPGEEPIAEKRVVSANYFQVIRGRLGAGRFFDSRETTSGAPAVIVNETFARRWFPNEDPIGKRVDFRWDTEGLQTIVGVVKDVREGALDQPVNAAIYIPIEQRSTDGVYMLIRGSMEPGPIIRTVRQKVRDLDHDLPIFEVRTLHEILRTSTSSHALSASIMGTFAALALLLAAVGLYGVISYAVVQRTQELGIRVALGARRGALMGLVLKQGLGFVGTGIVLGGIASLGFGKLIARQLYGVAPTDAPTFGAVAVLLATVAVAATLVPAIRATRADPLRVLRQE